MYNLTDLANKCLQVASQFASHTTNEVGTEHVLYALTNWTILFFKLPNSDMSNG